MLPILVEKLHEDEWRQIAEDSAEFGFFLIAPPSAFPQSDRKPAAGNSAPCARTGGGRPHQPAHRLL